jgi:adenine-specific DNA-methyltransferase
LLGNIPSKKPKTIFYKPSYSSGNGTLQIEKLFNKRVFSNPKPLQLLWDFIEIGLSRNDTILDFFAGSGTIADAVMQLCLPEFCYLP